MRFADHARPDTYVNIFVAYGAIAHHA